MIDDYGKGLYADLLRYYDVDLLDVIRGNGPAPSLVVSLAMALPDTSYTVALASGGPEHYGWGVDRHMTADIFDAINQQTRVTGNWAKGKAPKMPAWPRPNRKAETPEQKKPVSVKDIFNSFNRR